MIKIKKTDVYGFESAIRGMRNSWNSWDKSDSDYNSWGTSNGHTDLYVIGENDLALMKKLSKAGTDHSKYLRMINVTCDITAPLYWWKEFSTYKVGTVANSCSTMHTIADKEFTLDDFSCEHLDDIFRLVLPINEYGTEEVIVTHKSWLKHTIFVLNCIRAKYLETQDKHWWWQIIQLLPSSYNQKRTVQLNYQVLKSMYHSRKNHRLDEWHTFCEWVEGLPYSELITEG